MRITLNNTITMIDPFILNINFINIIFTPRINKTGQMLLKQKEIFLLGMNWRVLNHRIYEKKKTLFILYVPQFSNVLGVK